MSDVPSERKAPVSVPDVLTDPDEPSSALDVATRAPLSSHNTLRSRFSLIVRERRSRQVLLALTAIMLVVLMLGPTILGDMARQGNISNRLLPPLSIDHGWRYVMGADAIGRSFLGLLIVAGRTTLLIAASATVVAAIAGTVLGVTVGYIGGFADSIVMRIADMLLAFPTLLLALVILYTLPGGVGTIVAVLAVTRVAVFIRVARGETLVVRERLHVKASRALGSSTLRIMGRQIVPVIAPTMIVISTMEFARIMLAEATLSFLGMGVQPPDITWGMLIANGQNYLRQAWWVAVMPGVAIAFSTLTLYMLAEWIRRAQDV